MFCVERGGRLVSKAGDTGGHGSLSDKDAIIASQPVSAYRRSAQGLSYDFDEGQADFVERASQTQLVRHGDVWNLGTAAMDRWDVRHLLKSAFWILLPRGSRSDGPTATKDALARSAAQEARIVPQTDISSVRRWTFACRLQLLLSKQERNRRMRAVGVNSCRGAAPFGTQDIGSDLEPLSLS